MTPKLQTQAAECGLVCLAMIATAHGQHWDLNDLRRRFPLSLKGATLESIIAYSAELGLAARPLRLDLDELRELALPCILHWDLNHFVVLEKVSRADITILDPAVGRRRVAMADVSRHFTGVALELTPTVEFEEQPPKPRLSLSRLTGQVSGVWRSLAQIFALALVLELFAITGPILNQLVLDNVLTSGDLDLLDVLIAGFALLLLVQTFIALVRSWMVMVLGQTVGLQWVGNVFAHMVKLPADYFEKRHLGDITSRFSAVGAIQRTLTTSVVEAMLDGLMAITSLVMMFVYAPVLAVPVLISCAAYALMRRLSYQPYRNAAAERMVLSAKENTHFIETIRSIVPLKLYGREDERRARWQNLIVEVQNRDIKTARMNIWYACANTLIFGIENLVIFWLGARMVIHGQTGVAGGISVGMLFAFLSYKGQFTGRVAGLINYTVQLRMLSLHTERLGDIVLTERERDTEDGNIPYNDLEHLEPSIELRNVSFRYATGEPWVLKDVNLTIRSGESVAITGPSGAGKTTLLKIALGLQQPTEGEVRYGGIPIRQLGLANVRKKIGTVMQDDALLSGSLTDNVTFFDTLPDRERVEQCARLANLHEEIVRMPMGFHTLVGDLGTGLSGGQKQRLLLARALYKQPKILALDEATSHLDVDNEKLITEALKRMDVTRMIIAHRPETIKGAQRIIKIKDGAVIEMMQSVDPGRRIEEAQAVS
ncbi:peptidase domain-containing ABC transporter [Massilia sp. ZL223]|uniref:peptidase domain-containing ABC transporter n=1 Tax=Massilia sp. ZL223 TaxID=2824904 RepID=UPI001B83F684|nr:peptidase domain-containing ABC transporter [Massilia sp. ZL223]MBQ5961866.1 peptidase domain-containing ABC transporter [Massilia sp. ZL223]